MKFYGIWILFGDGEYTKMNFKLLTILILTSIISLFAFSGTAFAASDDKIVMLYTNSGVLVIEFFPDDAPDTVENFLKLIENGFYDNTIFHRIIKDFMIQGGDPLTKHSEDGFININKWGTGDPGYTIPAEFNTIKHNKGIVSMARSSDPDSAGSQFFIVHKDSNFLDEQYTVFGRILTEESYNTLDVIANLETTSKDIPNDLAAVEIFKTEIHTRADIEYHCKCNTNLGEPERTGSAESAAATSDRYVNKEYNFSLIPPKGWQFAFPAPGGTQDVPVITFIGPSKNTGQFREIGGSDEVSPFIYINVNKLETHTFQEHLDSRATEYHKMNESGALEIQSENIVEFYSDQGKRYSAYVLFAIQPGAASGTVPFAQAILSHSDFVYGITYANYVTFFDDDLPIFYNVLNSFDTASESGIDEHLEEAGIKTNPLNTVDLLEARQVAVDELEKAQIKAAEAEATEQQGGGCLIATAAFGSEMAPQVQFLREIRDNTVLQTESGTSFMTGFNQFYYSFSPAIADYERQNPTFKEAVKLALTPLLTSLALLQYADIDSESEMLGYGIGIIILNIGMYFVAPTVLIMKVRSFHKLQ